MTMQPEVEGLRRTGHEANEDTSNNFVDSESVSMSPHFRFVNVLGAKLKEVVLPFEEEVVHESERDESVPAKLEKRGGTKTSFGTIISAPKRVSKEMSEQLEVAKSQGRKRLRRLRGPPLFAGACCAILSVCAKLLSTKLHGSVFLHELWAACAGASVLLAFPLLLLPLVPTDRKGIRLCSMFYILAASFWTAYFFRRSMKLAREVHSGNCFEIYVDDVGLDAPCWFFVAKSVLYGAMGIISVCALCYTSCRLIQSCCCRMRLSILLVSLRRMTAFQHIGVGVALLILVILAFPAGAGTEHCAFLMPIGINVVVTYISVQPRLIFRLQNWLMSRGESAAAAAGISSLLGGNKVETILHTARNTFSGVSADMLTEKDMANNTPDETLASLTQKKKLGEVDAFVSHSWHDDPGAKWEALQSWRKVFKERNQGAEPVLWIDKYCIDQKRIDDSLACLPVYLSGCQRLLILCGSTYLNRLWCLIEIFVFLEMGGKPSNLDVFLLEDLGQKLDTFDPRKARCFTYHDTIRLHHVVQATGYSAIIELVRSAFDERTMSHRESMITRPADASADVVRVSFSLSSDSDGSQRPLVSDSGGCGT